ncbi:tigger transposable element-derived protein 1-like [Palaemon carinicauda]|uniref:tigger transposable element-derived protein 1-like n=1 Tax=Palaemon carinicauda TaxID=392227 RepID=UPI0035B5919B
MGPKVASEVKGRSKKMITMETKLEIIKKYEEGTRIVTFASTYGRNQCTIGTIIKNKEAIKASKYSKGMTVLASGRTLISDEIERFLLWIKDKEIACDTLTQSALVTRTIFIEWINVCFGPAVKNYLEENDLPLQCLLVLDSAPAHPPDFSLIKVLYLPPNTTPLLQPMDQQVIANFKKLYTKHLFKRCFKVTESTHLTLSEFWRGHFDIVQCLKTIDTAWNEVSRRTLNSSWMKLWPAVVAERDFKGFNPSTEDSAPEGDVEEIISIGRSMGLVVDKADISQRI